MSDRPADFRPVCLTEPVPGEPELVSEDSRMGFRDAAGALLGMNVVSAGLSLVNETVIGHSALGFNQLLMEAVDTGMAVGLLESARRDRNGDFESASKFREKLYGLHILIAAVGIGESARLIREGETPSISNIAVSSLVAMMNLGYLRHFRRHRQGVAHTEAPTVMDAFDDPIEVVQDSMHDLPTAEIAYEMNRNGTTAIAQTNLAESGGGLFGAIGQFLAPFGSAAAAIGSNVAVIGLMGRQMWRERVLRKENLATV